MKQWVATRVTELLGIEEEVLISMIHNHLIDQVGCDRVVVVLQGSKGKLPRA